MRSTNKAVTVNGLARMLRRDGLFDRVMQQMPQETKAAFEQPFAHASYPAEISDMVLAEVARLEGVERVERLVFDWTELSFKGIVGPLAKLLMTVTGAGPHGLFRRFDTLVSAGGDGRQCNWVEEGPKGGVLTISTEVASIPIANHSWKGVAEYVLHFAGVKGSVEPLPRASEGRDIRLKIQWL